MMNKRLILGSALMFLFIFLTACGSNAENGASEDGSDFPDDTIELIIPFNPGGSTDATARIIAEAAGDYLPNDQNIVVRNEPGASGTLGLTEVYQSEGDGYTLAFTPAGALSLQPLFGNSVYNYDSFQPVVRVSTSPMLLLVSADAEWDTLEEWVDWVESNPGEFSYGSSGTGNPGNVAMEKLVNELDLDVNHIAYEGQSEVFADLLGGHIDASSGSSQEGRDLVEEGDLKVLANLGSLKDDWFEDVPTLQDEGIDVSTDLYFGIVAPEDIPEDRLEILNTAFEEALNDPEVIERYEAAGVQVDYGDPDDFKEQIIDYSESTREVLVEMGLID